MAAVASPAVASLAVAAAYRPAAAHRAVRWAVPPVRRRAGRHRLRSFRTCDQIPDAAHTEGPRTPAIGSLKFPSLLLPSGYSILQNQLAQAQNQLAQAQQQLVGLPGGPIARQEQQLAQIRASADPGPAPAGPVRPAVPAGASAGPGRHRPSRATRGPSAPLVVNSGIALAIAAVLAVLAGWLVAGRCSAHPDHHPHGPQDLLHQPARAAGPGRPGRRTQGIGTPSTACSRGSKPPSRLSGTSSPTPPTSCAPRSRPSAPSSGRAR